MASTLEQKLQELLDIQAIRDVSTRYNRLIDAADGDAYAALWTEDCLFEAGAGVRLHGRDQIAAAGKGNKNIKHFSLDSQVSLTGTSTAKQASKMLLFYLADDGASMDFVCSATVTDEFVKIGEEWLIKHRKSLMDIDQEAAFKKMKLST